MKFSDLKQTTKRRSSTRQWVVFGSLAAVLVVGLWILWSPVQAETRLSQDPAVRGLTAGGAHACAIYNQAEILYCWGLNDRGQLGTDDAPLNHSQPDTAVGGLLTGKKASAVAAGFAHTCAVAEGGVYCWGANDKGQLGNGTSIDSDEPVLVNGLSGVTDIYAGFATTCAKAGDIYCWGDNDEGQFGNGMTTPTPIDMPLLLTGTSGVDDLAIGVAHSCRVIGGAASCSGAGANGQLGDGSGDDSLVPIAVSGIDGEVTSVSVGFFGSCAVTNLGKFYCWGDDTSGQVGVGAAFTARLLKDYGSVVPIASGYAHNCAEFYCIGENGSGQLGDGTVVSNPAMTAVDDTSGLLDGLTAKQIAAGFDFTCWVAGNADSPLQDAVFCAGEGTDGQLGDGLSTNSSVPVAVDTDLVEREEIYISLSADLDPNEINLSVTPNGNLAAGSVNLTVITNNNSGYNLLIKAGSADLECQTNASWKIPAQSVNDTALEVNHWGYEKGSAEPTTWKGVNTTNASLDGLGTATFADGHRTETWFGVRATTLPACNSYTGIVTFSAVKI
ncbi:MAG: hypothetical protein LBK50_01140 [Candidatus Nomurabacteria bacterium]|jgi:alpha-tubulin suppressor-like RCC1 family protein|nr:hypothetical protein [Candidatus Nomurabacteria bacterium]